MKYKFLVFSLLSLLSFNAFAQNEEDAIKRTINRFFEGMNTSDTSKLEASLSKSAVFHSITREKTVKTESIPGFLASIAKAEKGSLEEKITFDRILIDDNLASVWTSYKFYFKRNFSHCGVNSFQLVKENDEEWKIVHIIDTRRKDDCD